MMGDLPDNLEAADPKARSFPPSWRDAAIRSLYDHKQNGVVCLGCGQLFHGRRNLSRLQADHIVPWSRGGLTTWNNLQILCRPCNLAKLDGLWEPTSSRWLTKTNAA
jgi:5-methylcytosine-specific restriction endonuclease McrA